MRTTTIRAALAAICVAVAALPLQAYNHAHRWSFNGDYSDSVGTLTATPTGSPTFSNGMLVLPGGNKGTGNVDLGENALSVGSDSITIARVAPTGSYHRYENITGACIFDYTTLERTAGVYADASRWADESIAALGRFRAELPREIGISYDEWNIWYSWFREEGIVEGLYVAKMLNMMMRNWESLGLKCVCYFQAVNEQAICVNPFESHLTAAGEAMRLWKGHVRGVPVAGATSAPLPDNAFVTDHKDGSRHITFYNFSVEKPCTFRIPIDGRGKIVAEETLVPNGFEIGCRFERKQGTGKIVGGFYELTLAPASLSCARLQGADT